MNDSRFVVIYLPSVSITIGDTEVTTGTPSVESSGSVIDPVQVPDPIPTPEEQRRGDEYVLVGTPGTRKQQVATGELAFDALPIPNGIVKLRLKQLARGLDEVHFGSTYPNVREQIYCYGEFAGNGKVTPKVIGRFVTLTAELNEWSSAVPCFSVETFATTIMPTVNGETQRENVCPSFKAIGGIQFGEYVHSERHSYEKIADRTASVDQYRLEIAHLRKVIRVGITPMEEVCL